MMSLHQRYRCPRIFVMPVSVFSRSFVAKFPRVDHLVEALLIVFEKQILGQNSGNLDSVATGPST